MNTIMRLYCTSSNWDIMMHWFMKKSIRNYNALWIVWLLWVTAILYFMLGSHRDGFPNDVIVIHIIYLLSLIMIVFFIIKKVYAITMFKSKKKPVSTPQSSSQNLTEWICPYISRHLLSLNPLLACCRRYSRGER